MTFTDNEIVVMAKEACKTDVGFTTFTISTKHLQVFAEMVAAKAIAGLESQERNFCPRCGKRTNDIHTCTPPHHTWVGLTNEELTDLFYNTNLGQQSAVAQAIALLKEKNT
jgi:hypothetical protein